MSESNPTLPRQARKDRLIDLIALLRDGKLHRGQDLASALNVTLRTLYRDMDTLVRSGVPVEGARGRGYWMSAPITLPPLNLSMQELEALHLGLAVMTEADDPALQVAARSLADKVDDALPENRVSSAVGWGLAVHPFADAAAGIRHVPVLRSGIRNRHKLYMCYFEADGGLFESTVRPVQLDYWGRVWTCEVWCEKDRCFKNLRMDRVKSVEELHATFRDVEG